MIIKGNVNYILRLVLIKKRKKKRSSNNRSSFMEVGKDSAGEGGSMVALVEIGGNNIGGGG